MADQDAPFDVAEIGTAFQMEARSWLLANFPPSLAFKNAVRYQNDAPFAEADPDFHLWRKRMADKGWGAPDWPVLYGGGGLSAEETRLLNREMLRIGAFNPMRSAGYTMLGPTLLEYGSEEQKAQHLPPIARGETRWCQGFSEPGAGSDLASLQTRCIDAGDHWLVNGQKIWTSGANHSDWCFALVRTDTSHKQRGISFLLIDMRSPGVETRPIILITGANHFCELFLTDVAVPKANMVGAMNQGWSIAKRLLQHERDSLAEGRGDSDSLAELARLRLGVDEAERIADPRLRDRIIDHEMRKQAFNLTMQRVARQAGSPEVQALAPALKNLGSDIAQERADLTIELLGLDGLGWAGEAYSEVELDAARQWLHSKAFSIYGGSQEIQHNIVARRILGLPSA